MAMRTRLGTGIFFLICLAAPALAHAQADASSDSEQALRNADTRDKFRSNGMSPAPGTPEEFGAFLRSESARYAKVVREAGVKVD